MDKSQFAPQMWEHHGNAMRAKNATTHMTPAWHWSKQSRCLFLRLCSLHVEVTWYLALVQLWGRHLCEPEGARGVGQSSQFKIGSDFPVAYTGGTCLALVSAGDSEAGVHSAFGGFVLTKTCLQC